MNIALVTDSACDIPYEMAREHQIHIVPNILVIEGESVDDDEEFSRQEFYEQLPNMDTFPTTSTASAGRYQTLYQNLFDKGFDQVVSVHVSHHLSGIFNAASTAAQSFSGKVHVVDSLQVSLGLGFQVLEAAQALAGGDQPVNSLGLLPGQLRSQRDERSVLLLIPLGLRECLVDGRDDLATRRLEVLVPRQYDVATIRQRPADRRMRFAAHDDRLAGCQPLEVAKIVGQVPGKVTIAADHIVAGGGDDQADRHTATAALICGWAS